MYIQSRLKAIKKYCVSEKSRAKEVEGLAPMDAVKKHIKEDIARSEAYLADLFLQKPQFSALTDHQLRTIAQSVEKVVLPKGSVLMQQDELGDRCYILEIGTASVHRKLLDDSSIEMESLGNDSMIGEMCFFTDELRPTTITITSDNAKLFMLLKSSYLSIINSTKQIVVEIRDHLARDVVSKVRIFQKLTSSNRQQVLDAMIAVVYPERTYICRQGKIGRGFYVITSGKCVVTVNLPDKSGEKEVRVLESGDYFGG